MKLLLLAAAAALLGAGAWAEDGEQRSPPRLSVADYRGRLESLESLLRGGELERARAEARSLLAARIAFGAEALDPDPSVLGSVERIEDARGAARAARRIAGLRDALVGAGTDAEIPSPEPARLERLQREQDLAPIEQGGDVALGLPLEPVSLPDRVREMLLAAWDWTADVFAKLWAWLKRLWPRSARRPNEISGFGLNLAVLLLVAAVIALLAVLALRALRRSRDSGELASAHPARSARDEDPLSREAGEWERYALELAAAGRRREAIRAWYHAVLVTLFRAGSLHFQKGRTNWEYASRLPPEAPWRPSFLRITRSFDREWYGHDTSTSDSLRECAAEARQILRALGGAGAPA